MNNPDYELVVRLVRDETDSELEFTSIDVSDSFKAWTGNLTVKNVRQIQHAISTASRNGKIVKVRPLKNRDRKGGNMWVWCGISSKAEAGCCPTCKQKLPEKKAEVIKQSGRDGVALTKWLT